MNGDIVLTPEDFARLQHELTHPDPEYLRKRDALFHEIDEHIHIVERNGKDTVIEIDDLDFLP